MPLPRWSLVLTHSQKRLERIERLKDDPYYIFDKKEIEKPIQPASSDVDSIPIVRLDDLMPIAPSPPYSTRRDITALLISLHCSTSTTRNHPPGRFSNIATSKARVRGRQGGRDADILQVVNTSNLPVHFPKSERIPSIDVIHTGFCVILPDLSRGGRRNPSVKEP